MSGNIADKVRTSRLPGFRNLGIDGRIAVLAEFAGLSGKDVEFMQSTFTPYFTKEQADTYIENCVAASPSAPMGIVTNARINGEDCLIPVVVEEPSIVAAASRGFLAARESGVEAGSIGNKMMGQMYITSVPDTHTLRQRVEEREGVLLSYANEPHRHTRATKLAVRTMPGEAIVNIYVETGDVQGANVVNQMCEALAPKIAKLSGGEVVTAILSNYAVECLASATMRVPKAYLARFLHGWDDPEKVSERFLKLANLADTDIHRATTHNKGIMNGVVGVGNATGQDTRALESAAHAYAARYPHYSGLSSWCDDGDHLSGKLEMPVPVGTVRGATGLPYAALGLKILGNPSAQRLQEIMVATGLANNFSAIHTLVTDGINRGHLELHNKRF